MHRFSYTTFLAAVPGLALALFALSAPVPASAEDPTISSAVEQSSSLSPTEKLRFVEGAVTSTSGWISGLEAEKEKAIKDRQLSDEERKVVVECYDAILTPMREMLESMRRSSNEMQSALAESNGVFADLAYKRVAVVYKLAGEKQAESTACAAGDSKKSGDALVSMDEGAPSNASALTDVVIPQIPEVSAGG